MYNIESYTEGTLDHISLALFERRLKKDKSFRRKVELYKDVDVMMQGALMATAAEKEMIEKRINVIAAGFVNDFFTKKEKPENIRRIFNWS